MYNFRVHQDNIKLHENQQTPSREKLITMKRAMDVAEQSANLYSLVCTFFNVSQAKVFLKHAHLDILET